MQVGGWGGGGGGGRVWYKEESRGGGGGGGGTLYPYPTSIIHNDYCCAGADRGPQVNQPSAATGDHGNTPVSVHHNGYTKDVCVYIVHMLQPPKSTPTPGLITDTQQCM